MADRITLYHKPTCSKSREAKKLLDEAGIEYETVHYIDDPPSLDELKRIAKILDGEPKMLIRPKEALEAGFEWTRDHPDDEVLAFIAKHPECLQRPIVVVGKETAIIGRPTEKVTELIAALRAEH